MSDQCLIDKTNQNHNISNDEFVQIPTANRLAVRMPGRIDKIRTQIPRKDCHVPEKVEGLFPKIIQDRLVEEKLPHILDLEIVGELHYTRGRLGQPVMRYPTNGYTTADEYHRNKVIKSYYPLHDPNLAEYLNRPVIKHQLKIQGLLTEDDKVICDLKTFNDYRRYLGEKEKEEIANIFREQVTKQLKNQEERVKLRKLELEERRKENIIGQNISLVQDRKRERIQRMKERIVKMRIVEEMKQNQAESMRKKLQDELKKTHICRDYHRKLVHLRCRHSGREYKSDRIQHILSMEKEIEMRLTDQKEMIESDKKLKKTLAWDDYIERQKNAKGDYAKIQEMLDMKSKCNAERYRKEMQAKYENTPNVIAYTRAKKMRIENLVRRYFNTWRYKAARQKERREKASKDHTSTWDVTKIQDEINEELCENRTKIVDMKSLLAAIRMQREMEMKELRMLEEEEEEIEQATLRIETGTSQGSTNHEVNEESQAKRKQLTA